MIIRFDLPMSEIVFDFYDKLKSVSKGYASFDYHPIGSRESDLVKMDILIHADSVDALGQIVHKEKAHTIGRGMSLA